MKGQATKKSLKNKLADGGEEKYAIKRDTSTNFNELVNSLGYVKARTLLKKVEMNAHLEVIKRADVEVNEKRRVDRLKEMIRLSNSTGAPSSETAIEKLLMLQIGAHILDMRDRVRLNNSKILIVMLHFGRP